MTGHHQSGAAVAITMPKHGRARVGMTMLHISFGEQSHV